jgi:hypothetical protein
MNVGIAQQQLAAPNFEEQAMKRREVLWLIAGAALAAPVAISCAAA